MNHENLFAANTMRVVSRRLLPFLMLLYLVAYLDRSNISVAALQMNADLGLSSRMYGLGAGLFYVTYIIFEIPSNVALTSVGARRWIARIMITWGLVATGMAFIKTPFQLYGMRLLLGAAEAGFTPGIIYYISQWFPSNSRAGAMSFFYIAAALASVIGLPLSGALLELHGVFGFSGWRWLYLLEGLPAFLLGFVVLRYLPDSIQKAKWLLPEQRSWLSEAIARDAGAVGRGLHSKWYFIFANGKVWLLSLFWLLQAFGTIGITLFLPQMVKGISGSTNFMISLLSALPFLFACFFMFFNSRSSDARRERRFHLSIPLILSGLLLIAGIYTGITVTYVFLVVSIALNWAVTPVFWAVTTEYLSAGSVAAGSIAMINAIANIAGVVLPYAIGYIRDTTGSYDLALWGVGIVLMLGGLLGYSMVGKISPQRHFGGGIYGAGV